MTIANLLWALGFAAFSLTAVGYGIWYGIKTGRRPR